MYQTVLIRNQYLDVQTLGNLFVFDGTSIIFKCKTLELPWLGNKQGISCIPEGAYQIEKRHSPGLNRKVLWLKNVPSRKWIYIHSGNYYTQIEGCILPGDRHNDINRDGWRDVRNSRYVMQKLLQLDIRSITIVSV